MILEINVILERITQTASPLKTIAPTQSLPSLLRDEHIFGTRERDPFVPRSDTYYFPSRSCYILVEDTTLQHRPIVIKEYDRPRKGHDPDWPILYGGCEGRGGFYHYRGTIKYERKVKPLPIVNAAAAAVETSNGHAFAAARAVGNNIAPPNLRRALSMQTINQKVDSIRGGLIGKGEYIAASGNSQIITSTTATSTRSGAPNRLGHNATIDKRLAFLNQRTVPAMGSSLGLNGSKMLKNMLNDIEKEGKLKRSASVDAGLNMKVPPPRQIVKKPGYCENCRIKYDDFTQVSFDCFQVTTSRSMLMTCPLQHVLTSKHRRFAQNPKNWIELDELLTKITRPLLIDLSTPSPEPEEFPPSRSSESETEEGDSGFHEVGLSQLRCLMECESCGEEEEDDEEDDQDEEDQEEEGDEEEEMQVLDEDEELRIVQEKKRPGWDPAW